LDIDNNGVLNRRSPRPTGRLEGQFFSLAY